MLRIFLRNVAIKISFVYITSLTLTFYIICAFFLEESNLVAKVRKLVGLRVHFIFSVVLPQNLTQMFSKSAQVIPVNGRFALFHCTRLIGFWIVWLTAPWASILLCT